MKASIKILFFALLLAGAANTFAKLPKGAKTNLSEITDRHLSGFNAVNVAGSYDVYITQGAAESVKVEAPTKEIGHIITEVRDGVLKIYNKHDDWNWGNLFNNRRNRIIVRVVAKNLNAINLSGSGDVFFKEGISGNSLKLSIIGSGDVTGLVHVKTLESSISGSGDMRLSGTAENSAVRLVGSGDFSGRDLVTGSTAVHVSGSGDAHVNASNKVDASVAGSGDIYYTGGAKDISSSKSGSGDIHRF